MIRQRRNSCRRCTSHTDLKARSANHVTMIRQRRNSCRRCKSHTDLKARSVNHVNNQAIIWPLLDIYHYMDEAYGGSG
ncbi:hypothetical protein [Bartonella sp. CL34QHWL]|uniref:hypothetical protein n=1 Tax=Bartonella sp. CL34QHWL TaxID=3243526 RepID=UPI0035CF9508